MPDTSVTVRIAELNDLALAELTGLSGESGELDGRLNSLDEADSLAQDRPDLRAALASSRAQLWSRWAEVVPPAGKPHAHDQAVAARRRAIETTVEGSERLPLRRATLAAALLARFHSSGRGADLNEAIDLLEVVLRETPADRAERLPRANNLAVALHMRHDLTRRTGDLDRSAAVLRAEVDRATGPEGEALLLNLAQTYRARHLGSGDRADLDRSAGAARQAWEMSGSPAAAGGVGLALARSFDAGGGQHLLEEAVAWLSDAVDRTPPLDSNRPARLTNLANALMNRADFESGDRRDLDRAVALLRQALEATPPDSPDGPSRWSNLGGALRRRAGVHGDADDLREALTAYETAFARCPDTHTDRVAFLNNLANGLRDRYQRTGALADLDRAIDLLTEAESRTRTGAHRMTVLAGLGIAYGERAEQTGDRASHDGCVAAFRQAWGLTTEDHPMRTRQSINLANALRNRYAAFADRPDLDEAATLAETVTADPRTGGTGKRYPDVAEAWNCLAAVQADIATLDHSENAARRALVAARTAVDSADPQSPSWCEYVANLAQFAAESGLVPESEVDGLFRTAVTAGERNNLRAALYTAGNWARRLEDHEEWASATAAYQAALRAMTILLGSQAGRRDRERWLSSAQGMAARAAYAATSGPAGDPRLALDLLDRGQGVLLAAALTDAVAGPARTAGGQPGASYVPGAGEVVAALCATGRGGRALLLLPSGDVRDLDLPAVTTPWVSERAAGLAGLAPGRLRTLLADLGRHVMEPVLAACPAGTHYLILVPAGSLRLLPWHAAVVHDGYASDRVGIGYAPNLTSLAAAHRHVAAPVEPALAVDDPSPDPLPRSAWEVDNVERRFPGLRRIRFHEATADLVRDALGSAGLAHFSCHGRSDPDDPGRSGLQLADRLLSVRELLTLVPRLDNPARLVVLSACETAVVGKTLPDEAISVPVALFEWGATGVLGTLWRVPDDSTALLMNAFYRFWRDEQLPPAEALRRAQGELRAHTNGELVDQFPDLFAANAETVPARLRHRWSTAVRFADPYYWAGFVYLGV